jgi:hypothetical protein
MQLYAFRDIAKAPPAPFSPPVDLDKSLAALEQAPFGSDFEFHNVVRDIFLQLHDAHTNFYSPVPYQFAFALPFNLFAYGDANNRTLLEVSNILNKPENWPSLNVTELVGATGITFFSSLSLSLFYFSCKMFSSILSVVSINDVPAVDYVREFAEQRVGLAKDPQVRFNIALLQRAPVSGFDSGLSVPWRGLLTFRPHHFMPAPENATITLDLVLANVRCACCRELLLF